KRAKRVKRFADQPLPVTRLEIACGDIVENRIAEHVIHRSRAVDAPATLADNNSQLRFIIDGRADLRQALYALTTRDNAFRHLGENDWNFWNNIRSIACAGIKSAS